MFFTKSKLWQFIFKNADILFIFVLPKKALIQLNIKSAIKTVKIN